ncbi:glycosyltransferase family 4 protein [Gramella sp. AN32]|uniref:Glycosyltransferase family 4 protein n=1 Tax=Christiangramia antarctica TaxID=2058158 RepID=A0ABW5X8U9_9FLAO|nr:glycosyltransferase family 4 protein [Gramella sp. AN32]MCM4154562.1 glycosyltransferase family 1 protein [Gramella sp. AN32]
MYFCSINKASKLISRNKLNILHLSATYNWGGGENHIENLCDELTKIDSEINNYILCPRQSEFHAVLKKKKLSFYTASLAIKFDLRYVSKIIRLTRKLKIDLIHIHDSTALTLSVMATKLAKLPPFVLSKKTSFAIKNRKGTLYKYNHSNIAKILCVSERTKSVTSESVKDKEKLVTIYHGTRVPKEETKIIDLRKKLNIPKDKILVGTIANHIRAKNLQNYIDAVDYVINKLNRKDFHFVEIGSFTRRSQTYFESIKSKGLEKHISFLDFLPEASQVIPQFDISFLTSQSEGIPQFIYESFYYEVPVVSTNVGGIPEIIKHGENGYLCDPHNPACLGDKLIALHSDKELRKKFTEVSFKKLHTNYTSAIMAQKTLEVYKEIIYGEV